MKKPCVFILEDDPITQIFYREALKNDFQICGIFDNGNDAIAQVDDLNPDIILSDIVLKGHPDGIETVRRILTKHDLPSLFITSQMDSQTIERAKITRPYGYFVKPLERFELIANINIALDLYNQLKGITNTKNHDTPDSNSIMDEFNESFKQQHQIKDITQTDDQNQRRIEIVNNKFMKQYWILE